MLLRVLFITSVLTLSTLLNAAPLTEADVVRQAVRASPALKKAQADLARARSETKMQRGNLFPTIDAVGAATNRDNAVTSTNNTDKEYSAYLRATQPLYVGGAISGGIDLLKTDEAIADLELRGTQHQVIADALGAYYAAIQSARLLAAAQENLRIQKDYVGVIRRYAKIGRARRTDLMQAEVNYLSAEADVADLASRHDQAVAELRRQLVLDAGQEIELTVPVNVPQDFVPDSDAVKKALVSNPGFLAEKLRRNRVDYEKEVAMSSDLPSLELEGQFGYRSTDDSNPIDADNEYSSATLNLTVPLFSGLSSLYKRRSYNYAAEAQTREVERARLELTTQAENLVTDIRENRKRLDLVRRAASEARKALDMANRDYQRNLVSTQDVISLQRTRYDSERLLITTEMGYLTNILLLRQVMGSDLLGTYAKP